MGLDTESFRNASLFQSDQQLSAKAADDIQCLEDETHSYIFLSQIKQSFNTSKSNFLNPEVLKIANIQAIENIVKGDNTYFSPITSDEEA